MYGNTMQCNSRGPEVSGAFMEVHQEASWTPQSLDRPEKGERFRAKWAVGQYLVPSLTQSVVSPLLLPKNRLRSS
jgi:hypothetical protein